MVKKTDLHGRANRATVKFAVSTEMFWAITVLNLALGYRTRASQKVALYELNRDLLSEAPVVIGLKPYSMIQTRVFGNKPNTTTSHQRLYNFENIQFLGHLDIGTPAQKFIAIYDTGSSLLWITGNCITGGCQHHNRFDANHSKTYKPLTNKDGRIEHEFIQYGTGSCILELGSDKVSIGSMKLDNQLFGAAKRESLHPFVDVPTDGLVGLSFGDEGSPLTRSPLIGTIMTQHRLKRNIFAIYFSFDESDLGSISWGSVDPRFAEDPLYKPIWIPLIGTDYWRVSYY